MIPLHSSSSWHCIKLLLVLPVTLYFDLQGLYWVCATPNSLLQKVKHEVNVRIAIASHNMDFFFICKAKFLPLQLSRKAVIWVLAWRTSFNEALLEFNWHFSVAICWSSCSFSRLTFSLYWSRLAISSNLSCASVRRSLSDVTVFWVWFWSSKHRTKTTTLLIIQNNISSDCHFSLL